MNFVTWSFLTFSLIVLLLRVTIGRDGNSSSYLLGLLFASLLFFAFHTPVYIFLILISALVDYIAGDLLSKSEDSFKRKFVLGFSICINLGLLAYFKYSYFFLSNFQEFFDIQTGDGLFGSTVSKLVLPIGISFFTFQSMSYTIDVYRKELSPARRFTDFLLYVSFFPQLVAGPIVRAKDFLYQLPRKRKIRFRIILEGFRLIIRGLFLKLVIADNIGTYLGGVEGHIDGVWDENYQPGSNSSIAWFCAFLFSIQIFCDFAGYTDIARGFAYLLGFKLPINFNWPYIAVSFSDFWRRWHISLSTWLRDYLYKPLGGNRRSGMRVYVNLLIVMVIGGLWHGAAWTYITWGAIHGSVLVLERVLGIRSYFDNKESKNRVRKILIGLTYFCAVQVIILVTWVFFRSTDLSFALLFINNMFSMNFYDLASASKGAVFSSEYIHLLIFVAIIIGMHIRAFLTERNPIFRVRRSEQAVWTAIMLVSIFTLYGESNDFIYFQF